MTSDLTTKAAEVRAGLARKLSDALLTVRPLGGSELFMRVGDEFYADPVVCAAEIAKLRSDLHEARSALARERREKGALIAQQAAELADEKGARETAERGGELILADLEQARAELAAERQRSDTLRVQRDGHAAELAEKAGIYDEQVTRAEKQWQAWETRATTAESERDELLREKERMGAALGQIVVADTHLVWTGGAVPEPSHEESGACAEIARAALLQGGGPNG
ncbi:hypothetical protein [Bosea sp. NPDC055594]